MGKRSERLSATGRRHHRWQQGSFPINTGKKATQHRTIGRTGTSQPSVRKGTGKTGANSSCRPLNLTTDRLRSGRKQTRKHAGSSVCTRAVACTIISVEVVEKDPWMVTERWQDWNFYSPAPQPPPHPTPHPPSPHPAGNNQCCHPRISEHFCNGTTSHSFFSSNVLFLLIVLKCPQGFLELYLLQLHFSG